MGSETPNFALYKPSNGEEGWSSEVNDNFNIIDDRLSEGFSTSKDGDGSTKSFSISHTLSSSPSAVHVQASSEDASTDFWVSNKNDQEIEITYASAPASGTGNLKYEVILHA